MDGSGRLWINPHTLSTFATGSSFHRSGSTTCITRITPCPTRRERWIAWALDPDLRRQNVAYDMASALMLVTELYARIRETHLMLRLRRLAATFQVRLLLIEAPSSRRTTDFLRSLPSNLQSAHSLDIQLIVCIECKINFCFDVY